MTKENLATRAFDLSDVLSVTTGVVLKDMDGIYDVMGFVTGDAGISTIGLAAMHDVAVERIFGEHPQLKDAKFPGIPKGLERDEAQRLCGEWVNAQKKVYGDTLTLTAPEQAKPRTLEDDADYVRTINPNAQIIAVKFE